MDAAWYDDTIEVGTGTQRETAIDMFLFLFSSSETEISNPRRIYPLAQIWRLSNLRQTRHDPADRPDPFWRFKSPTQSPAAYHHIDRVADLVFLRLLTLSLRRRNQGVIETTRRFG